MLGLLGVSVNVPLITSDLSSKLLSSPPDTCSRPPATPPLSLYRALGVGGRPGTGYFTPQPILCVGCNERYSATELEHQVGQVDWTNDLTTCF